MVVQRKNEKVLREVAERLRDLRNKRGISQDTVYIDTDVNVKRIEVGSINISLTTLVLLCNYYGVTLEEFFRGMDTKRQ